MNEVDQVMYNAFFDELGRIEKVGVLSKFAVNPLALGNVARTGLAMLRHPRMAGRTIGKIWQKGVASAPQGADFLTRVGKGVGALWGTPGGRAALLAGGGLSVAGLGAAGTVVGRASR